MSKEYVAVMNHSHNELGITKADIQGWVREAVFEIAEAYVDDQFSQQSLDARIIALVRSKTMRLWSKNHETLDEYIKDRIVDALLEGVQLEVKIKQPTADAIHALAASEKLI